MQPYAQAPMQPPPKKGMGALGIILIIFGILAVLGIGTCTVGYFVVKREAEKVMDDIKDGGLVLASPPAVTADLAGAKKDYVGSWTSAGGRSSLTIHANGDLHYEKDEDGDGVKEKITAPIAAFLGDDIEVKAFITIRIRVGTTPHKVGDHFAMTADGISFERK